MIWTDPNTPILQQDHFPKGAVSLGGRKGNGP